MSITTLSELDAHEAAVLEYWAARPAEADAVVAIVTEHATRNYERGGWDVIVECWSRDDILKAVGRAHSKVRVLKALRDVVSIYADRQADAANSAF